MSKLACTLSFTVGGVFIELPASINADFSTILPSPVPTPTPTPTPIPTPVFSLALPMLTELGGNASLHGWTPPGPLTAVASGFAKAFNSDTLIGLSGNMRLHIDNSMPYAVVDSSINPAVKVTINTTGYADESDIVMVPMTGSMVEGSYGDGDNHTLVIDRATGWIYELYHTNKDAAGGFTADQITIWDALAPSQRPWGYTSADAAGLSVLQGLLRYEDALNDTIRHAIRMTFNHTLTNSQGNCAYLPATHGAGDNYGGGLTNMSYPPAGQRLVLDAAFDASGLSPVMQHVVNGLKTYGAIVADNGSTGYVTADNDPRWNGDDIGALATALTLAKFHVVTDGGPLYYNGNTPLGNEPTISSFTADRLTGSAVQLLYTAPNASYCYIEGLQPVRNGKAIVPSQSSYTLVASNLYGRIKQTITVP